MRTLAFLTLPLLTMAAPALATEYSPATLPSSATQAARPRLIDAKPAKLGRSHVTARRRGGRVRTIDSPAGLIITDFKPDSRRAFANADYLPHLSENLTYETDDYRNRFWRLKKVSPGSVVASVKYRF
jgi:hypothetical protein